jgi:hypothetical protein
VLGIDPIAMAPLLRATGPVRVGATTVTGDSVADFVMRDEYALFPDPNHQEERKRQVALLAGAMYDRVTSGDAGSVDLLRAMAEAGASGHVQVWSADPEEQSVLRPLRIGGALPASRGAFLEVVSVNAAGNKADYYVRRKVAYERPRAGAARVTVTLSNLMKPQGLPLYVTGRFDKPQHPVEPGATRQVVNLLVGVGQRVRSVSIDGRTVDFYAGREQGHGVASVQVEIRPSQPVVITAEIDDPGGDLVYRQQPLVVPDELALAVPHRVT